MSFRVDIFETTNARTPVPGTLFFANHFEAVTFGEWLGDRFVITETDHPVNADFTNDRLTIH